MNVFGKIKQLLGKRAGIKMILLLGLPMVGAVLETVGVSTIVAFITIVMDGSILEKSPEVKMVYDLLKLQSYEQFVILIAVVLIGFYVFKTVYLILQYYVQNRLVKNMQHRLAGELLQNILKKPYEYFMNTNLAEITRMIGEDVQRTGEYILCFLQMISEVMTIIMLATLLLIIDFKMTIFICVFLVACMGVIRFYAKRKLKEAGKQQQVNLKERIKWMNQSVYGIKDIKICRNETFFEDKFNLANRQCINTEILYNFWMRTPTYLTEFAIMATMLLYLIMVVLSGRDISTMITSLSAIAFSAVRLLPAVNRISSNLTTISYRQPSFDLVYKMKQEYDSVKSEQKTEEVEACFENEIRGEGISFSYENSNKPIFENASFLIKKGMSVGVVGASGAGKTTIIDILLGLLKPQEGSVCVDGIEISQCYSGYLDKISYIPQNIFLTDDTIKNNVAFGIPEEEIDETRVWKALEEAQIKDYIETLPDGIQTEIGERGIRISGGQRQRIGIARALYSNPEVLVFDEATSALDNETEAAIMESINYFKGKKTMIIIAHRLTTIENCDIIYRVENGKIEPIK